MIGDFLALLRDCDDAVKDSIASALRHSRREAERTYDRRTCQEKKRAALDLAQAGSCRALEDEAQAQEDDQEEEQQQRADAAQRPTPGSFVGLVQEDSTLYRPRVLLGLVQTYPSRNEASLLWYKHVRKGVYVLELDGKQWVEPIQALVPVKTKPDKPSGGVRLVTSLRTIHKAIGH